MSSRTAEGRVKRMQIRFAEVAQEIAITHGIDEATVLLVLDAYSAATKRALSEDLIVEVLRDVRLQVEDYFDPRNSKKMRRLAVNNELQRLRRNGKTNPSTPIQQEDERASERLQLLDS